MSPAARRPARTAIFLPDEVINHEVTLVPIQAVVSAQHTPEAHRRQAGWQTFPQRA